MIFTRASVNLQNNLEMFNTFGISCFETNLSYIFLLENSNVPEGSRVPAGCPSATRGSLEPFVAILKLEVIKMCPALSTIGVNTRKVTSTTVAIRKL